MGISAPLGYSARLAKRSSAPEMQKPVRKLKIAPEIAEWSPNASAELYGIRNWGAGYFDINDKGEVTIRVPGEEGQSASVSLMDIIAGMQQRGLQMPVLLRIDNLLEAQIRLLNESFAKAIASLGYQSKY